MVEGDSTALAMDVNTTILATQTLHLETPQEVVADDTPGRVDVGQWLRVGGEGRRCYGLGGFFPPVTY